jgi:hypothetical protein
MDITSNSGFAPTSQVRTTAMLILSITGSKTVQRWYTIQWYDMYSKFHENRSVTHYKTRACRRIKESDGRTDTQLGNGFSKRIPKNCDVV